MWWAFIRSLPGQIAVTAVVGLLAFGLGELHGRQVATANAEARSAQATIKQLKERGMINEQVNHLDDCTLLHELNPDSVCNAEN